MIQRLWFWMKLYNPTLKLIPAPKSTINVWTRQYRPTIELFPDRTRSKFVRAWRDVKGLLLFIGLFRRDKLLWFGSWLFHVSLTILLLLHLKWILPIASWVDGEILRAVGRSAGWLLLASAMSLLVRRLLVTRVRQITSIADYIAELLFALAVATGLVAVYDRPDAEIMHRYLRSIIAFSPITKDIPLSIVIHLLIVQALLVVMPFSHLLHSGGIFIARRFLASPDSFSGDVDQP